MREDVRITKTVQYMNIKKGRKRKEIFVGKAGLSFTGKGVTPHGGMALVAQGMETFGVRSGFASLAAMIDGRYGHSTGKLLEQLVALRIMGGEALSDSAVLSDPALQAMFDWDGPAHPTTFARRLSRFDYGSNLVLQSIVGHLSRLTSSDTDRLIAIDSTVATVCGQNIQGARIGYNPHKPGRPSFHPLLAVDVGHRSVVDGYLRPGDTGTGNGLVGFIKKIIAGMKGDPTRVTFRLDKGLTSGAALDAIEAAGCGFVAKAKLTGPLHRKIESVNKWRSIGQGIYVANVRYQPNGWSKPRRFVVIERNEPPRNRDSQSWLFDLMEGRYEVVVTNLRLKADNVWRLYNRGAVVEQIIEELKNDFAACAIKTRGFWASDALFITGLIAYNLINCLKRLALPKSFRTARLKRIALVFLNLGANVVNHGRRLRIKIDRHYPFRQTFYLAMAKMAAA